MNLFDKLRAQPEWQSDDPVVRVAAVRNLSSELNSQELLIDIAHQDNDSLVRIEAITWIEDLDVVISIARNDEDATVRTVAREIVRDIVIDTEDEALGVRGIQVLSGSRDLVAVAAAARLPNVGLAALAELDGQRAIGLVARRAAASEVAVEALDRLEDSLELEVVATKAESKVIALTAFERLVQRHVGRDSLGQLAKRAKQKAVQRHARAALESLNTVEVIEDLNGSRSGESSKGHVGLCEELEAFREEEDLDRGRIVLDRLLLRWSELETEPEEGLGTRFTEARKLAEERLANLDSEIMVRRKDEERQNVSRAAAKQRIMEERILKMQNLLAEMEQLVTSDAEVGSKSGWNEVTDRWRRLVTVVGETESNDFTQLLARYSEIEELRKTREKILRVEREKTENDKLQRLKDLVSSVRELVSSENLQLVDGERQLRRVRQAIENPGLPSSRWRDSELRALKRVHSSLLGRVRELRDFADWQRWANLGLQEGLCRKMEELRELSNEAELTVRFREIMTGWRAASDVPKDKGAHLWQRFKLAHDVVFPRVEKHREAQATIRDQNFLRQKALVDEAERLSSSTDWLKTARRITELQSEWKTVGPVPRRNQKELWTRFRTACNMFFSRRKADLVERKQQWSSNLQAKEKLCERVEALVEADLPSAIASVKQAKSEWKAVGPVRRTRSESVWKRFSTACEVVFRRLKVSQREAEIESVNIREGLCVELEDLCQNDVTSESTSSLFARVSDVRARWRNASQVSPALGRKLKVRFEQGVARLVERFPDVFRGTDLDPARQLKKLLKLCERVEALKPADTEESQGVSPAEVLASKWRDALASNLMGERLDEAAERRSVVEEVRRAKQDLRFLGKIIGDDGHKLVVRFDRACNEVLRWTESRKQEHMSSSASQSV